MNVLSYHVFNSETRKWLSETETTWTSDFHSSASFTTLDMANDLMEREGGDYVFACIGSP